MSLRGYTSTSSNILTAKKFALKNLPEDKCPVIYHIEFKGNEGMFHLNNSNFTAYLEDEILVQDGFEYLVTSVEERNDLVPGKSILWVKLSYNPADSSD